MHRRFLRASLAFATTAAVLGGSLLMAPAANASTHKVDSDSKHIVQTVKVGSHKDKLVLDAVTKKSTGVRLAPADVAKTQYVAAKYKLVLKNSHKKVIYATHLTAWRAINLQITTQLHAFKSDSALVKFVKADAKKSELAAKKQARAIYTQLTAELASSFVVITGMYEVSGWIKDQTTTPTTFDGFTLSQPASGVVLTLAGTPAAYSITATLTKYHTSVTVTSTGSTKYSSNSLLNHLSVTA